MSEKLHGKNLLSPLRFLEAPQLLTKAVLLDFVEALQVLELVI